MGTKGRSFTREERIKLLKEYGVSGISPKEYAQVKGIGVSTLYKWSSQLRIPLLGVGGSKKNSSVESRTIKPESEPVPEGKRRRYKKHDIFLHPPASSLSFIDITSRIDKDSVSFSQQATQNLDSCSLEIRLPSGVMLKLEKVPFNHAWAQVVELVRALG